MSVFVRNFLNKKLVKKIMCILNAFFSKYLLVIFDPLIFDIVY